MGIFDTIRVEVEIPGCGDCSHEEFQTKSFDNVMENYIITKNNELYREKWEYDWVEDNSHFLKGRLTKIPGSYRREYLTDYHGDVIFYKGMEHKLWRNYYARFTEGTLKKIWYKDTQY